MGDAMRVLVWERKQLRFSAANPEWCYVRGDGERQIFVHDLEGDIFASYAKRPDEGDQSQPGGHPFV
jgi:hypothetical protein